MIKIFDFAENDINNPSETNTPGFNVALSKTVIQFCP